MSVIQEFTAGDHLRKVAAIAEESAQQSHAESGDTPENIQPTADDENQDRKTPIA